MSIYKPYFTAKYLIYKYNYMQLHIYYKIQLYKNKQYYVKNLNYTFIIYN